MELRQPETFRILDQHHCGVRNIDSHLDHRSGNKYIYHPRPESIHQSVFLRRFHFPVEHLDPDIRRQPCPKLLRIFLHILQIRLLRSFYHRTDHKNLPPALYLLFQKMPRTAPPVGADHTIFHRLPPDRKLFYNRNMQIPIEDHRQRPRDRCGAHHHYMRDTAALFFAFSHTLLRKSLPLSHAESVLFICNDQRQLMIIHLLLNQRMGAHDQITCSRLYFLINLPFLLCRQRTGQQHRLKRKAVFFRIPLQRLKMLHRQHLRRSHHRPLIAVCRRKKKGKRRKHRFSGTHIPLHQTVHRIFPCHITQNILPDLILILCQPKGQSFQKPPGIRRLQHGKGIRDSLRRSFHFFDQ